MSHNHEWPDERQDVPLGSEVIGNADERRDRERDEQITQADECAGPGQVPSQPVTLTRAVATVSARSMLTPFFSFITRIPFDSWSSYPLLAEMGALKY